MTSFNSLPTWMAGPLGSVRSRSTQWAAGSPVDRAGAWRPVPPAFWGRHGIWVACMALIAITVTGAGFLVWGMHDRTVATYERDANMLGTVLAERTTRYVQVVDQVLQELQLRVRSLDIQGPDDFQARLGTLETHHFLRDRMQNLPPANAFILIDAAGRIASPVAQCRSKRHRCVRRRFHASFRDIRRSRHVRRRHAGRAG